MLDIRVMFFKLRSDPRMLHQRHCFTSASRWSLRVVDRFIPDHIFKAVEASRMSGMLGML